MIHVRFNATPLPPGGALHVVFGAAAVPPDGYVEPGPATMQIGAPVRDAQQAAMRVAAVQVRDAWQAGQRIEAVAGTGYGAAGRCGRGVDTAYAAAVRAADGWSGGFEAALRRAAGWHDAAAPAARAAAGWCDLAAPAARAAMGRLAGWLAAARVGQHHAAAAGAALRLTVRGGSPWQAGRRAEAVSASRWQPGRRPPFGRWDAPAVPPLPAGCYTPPPGRAVHVRFALRAMPADLHVVFRCGDGASSAAVVIPVLKVYIVINSASLTRVSNNLALPVASLQIAIDADSAHWTWSATLPLAALGDLERDSPGVPVELEAAVNGAVWRLAVERIDEDERFGSASLRIGGRGIAAELSDPVYPVVQHDNLAGAMTAQQLAGQALSINGVPLGWSLDWQAADWLIPAGAWLFSGTPLAAVARLAEAAGAYVQPARATRTLHVLPRYPVKPWEWAAASAGVVLPAAATLVRSASHADKPDYNLVIVSGQTGGLIGRVKRAGTAGDRPAQMVVDPLISHVDAATGRAVAILGNTGPQVIARLETGVLAAAGVIPVGTLLDWTRSGTSRKGLVRGLSVSATAGAREPVKVRQTLEVEFHG